MSVKTFTKLDTKEGRIDFEVEGAAQIAHYTWFRGENCNFNPAIVNMISEESVMKHVVEGWQPAEPIIDRKTRITAFGSCFAENISKWLTERNYSVLTEEEESKSYVVRFGEGMVNSFVIRQQLEWAFENKIYDEELWHDYEARAFGYDEEVRQETLGIFNQTDLFIITFGLSEIWYDEVTGGVFWRAVPRQHYDKARHKFRIASAEENKENLRAIYQMIRKYRPESKIIFTLSPIPLVATFRNNSCITSNSVSKANLRVAIDEVYREFTGDGVLFYWPSYEIVMDVFPDRWIFDRRHVKKPILEFVMKLFGMSWCRDDDEGASLLDSWLIAASSGGLLPGAVEAAVRKRDRTVISTIRDDLIYAEQNEWAALLDRAIAGWAEAGKIEGNTDHP